jgi:hypothetical protein
MSDTATAPRWRVLFTPRWLGWHLFAVVAFFGMWWLGDWQLHRALSGNGLSWAYTFEWPIFAIFGAVFWVKTVKDELHPAPPPEPQEVLLPAGAGNSLGAAAGGGAGLGGTGAGLVSADVTDITHGAVTGQGTAATGRGVVQAERDEDDEPDPELAEYNAYLAKLNKEVKGHGKWHGLR